jgi:eukaryotic-like serine/threonine-protein kinase
MSDPVTRLNTALKDRYSIDRELGEGGMATVYLAEDLKHDRRVALKVLKPELAAVVGAERFLTEIKTTANLQHPHILPLFDSGEADSFLFYVMPYVEGESLRERLDRERQLPIEDAVRLSMSVGSALAYAHRQGVIHRDVKPENILLHEGESLIADFGIALAVKASSARLTETGLSVGTPYYMSPEQASADRELGAQSDIYSLGCVLYEMLAGEPPHTGGSAQAVLAKILTEDPRPLTELRRTVPANVGAAVSRSLERLPADRFNSAEDFVAALGDPSFSHEVGVSPATGQGLRPSQHPKSSWWSRVPNTALVLTTLAASALAGWFWLNPRGLKLTEYDVAFPREAPLALGDGRGMRTSPSGDFVVYIAAVEGGSQLWVRSLVDGAARVIPETDGAMWEVAISPDGNQIAFTTSEGTWIVALAGGSPRLIAAPSLIVRWSGEDGLLLSADDGRVLSWIDPETSEAIRSIDTGYCIGHEVLADSELALCGGGGDRYASVVGLVDLHLSRHLSRTIADGEEKLPLRGSDFRLVDGKYLVYVSIDGDLRATSVDMERMTVGPPVTITPGIRTASYTGFGAYDLTGDGTLVYASGPPANIGQLMKADPDGSIHALPIPPGAFLRFDVSSDGRRLVAVLEGLRGQEIHVYDLDTGREDAWLQGAFVGHPRWSPDGTQILVSIKDRPDSPSSWLLRGSPNASTVDTLAELSVSIGTYFADSLVIADHGTGATGEGVKLDLRSDPIVVDTIVPEGLFAPSLSPDGRWLTYGTVGAGIIEPFPSEGRHWPIATADSQLDAQWLSEREVGFFTQSGSSGAAWFRVQIQPGSDPPFGTFEPWFEDARFSDTPGASHAASHDGGIVYVRGSGLVTAGYLRVVPRWVRRMKREVDRAGR